ncbi:MAG: YigZ family protein [Oscillospiraceae bacterium]|nr:YigZ family protein [Oscillospiraceae bacterium]MBQ7130281.1 YigZ family protein [Oscillospiraceae bacterium]
MDEYLIPTQFGEDEFYEKKSRFIGRIWPVETEEEALEKIQAMKKQHYDATHNCWAYIIKDGAVRFSDDGEPGGTAGMPMLQVLQREGLYNVVCVVTRYFGGILLGAGGLVRAYTRGAKIAVDAAGKSMKRVWTVLYVPCPYTFYERVKLLVGECEGIIRQTDFGAEVELELLFPEANAQPFLDKLTDMTSGTVEGMELGQEYRAFPVNNS